MGLFTGWAGRDRISPTLRSGHVAMMAGERIPTDGYGNSEVHLIELFSTPGLSGSPVFAHETVFVPVRPIGKGDDYPIGATLAIGQIYLIGLVHGLMSVKVMQQILARKIEHTWHSGISMVVPSVKLLEIINQRSLLNYEKAVDKQMKRSSVIKTSVNPQETKAKRTRDIAVPPISRQEFFNNLSKATQRKKPSS